MNAPKQVALARVRAHHACQLLHVTRSQIAVAAAVMCIVFSAHLFVPVISQAIPPISQILQDLDSDASCNEFHKDCHCGSIAQGPGSRLFTRIVYPNSSTVIEEYDENVPYGYKYLRVYYRCADDEDILVGISGEGFWRECVNGNWKPGNLVPRCAFNLRNATKLKKIKISDYRYHAKSANLAAVANATVVSNDSLVEEPINAVTLHYEHDLKQSPNGTFEIPLQNQPEKCISWSLFPKQVWSLTLSEPTRIHYVRIKLYGDKIEDLHQSRDIAFEMSLKNVTYFVAPNESKNLPEHVKLPIEIKCRETFPKASQYVNSYQQKYSANYLVLDFLCEVENIQKSIFEYFFSYDYEVDQLYASVIEVRFSMLNLKVPSQEESSGLQDKSVDAISTEEIELAQKIFVTRLCALKVYAFNTDCGTPDIPVSAIVQREYNFLDDQERKTYKYICNDKNQELKGSSYVECGNYGRWKNEFPQCVHIRPCPLLTNIPTSSDYVLDVKYESTQATKAGVQVVPNGKYARFSCIKRNQTATDKAASLVATVTPPANVKAQHVMYQGMTQVICRNGKWIGLESNSNCISQMTRASTEASNVKVTNATNLDDPSVQLISLPVRLIRILFALFIILCLIIVSLVVYMFIFRPQMGQANNGKDFRLDSFDLNSNLIPTILYNDAIQSENNEGVIYSTENNVYERISQEDLETFQESDSHLYQTIRINNEVDNYSELSTYPHSLEHEERENSIYGMESMDIDVNSTADIELSVSPANQLTVNCYNQLDRSSSMFLKKNSIYEK